MRSILRRPWSWAAVSLLVYTAFAFALFANTWTAPASRWVGLEGDPDSTIWSIQWVAYATVHHLNPFITNYIFYPSDINILWGNADAPVALAWVALPFTLLFGPIVAYNILQTAAFALSAWAAAIAFRPLVGRAPMAFAGGLVYGFGPYMLGHAWGHLGLTFAVVPPLLFWLLYRLLVKRDVSPVWVGLAAGTLEAFQLLATSELVLTETVIAVAGVAWLAVIAFLLRWDVPWRDILRRTALATGVAAAVFAALAAYPVYTLLKGPSPITVGPVRLFGYYVTDLLNLVIPTGQTHLLHSDWTVQQSQVFYGGAPEAGAYLGIALLGVILFTTLRWWSDRAVLFAAGLLALALVVSMGPNLTVAGQHFTDIRLPWRLMRNVRFFNDILPDRFALYMDLCAGLLLALFIDHAWKARWRPARPLAVAACVASFALLLPSLPWASSSAHIPSLFQPGTDANRYFSSLVPDGGVVVILPAGALSQGQGYAMLWQATAGDTFRMPEGDILHGGPDGKGTNDPVPGPLWTAMSDLQLGTAPPSSTRDLALVANQLSDLRVRVVVVGPMARQDMAVAYFTLLLGSPPSNVGGAYVWPVTG